MKTKAMAMSLMLTFASCALFAQSKTDSIPKDSTPKTDTTKNNTSANTLKSNDASSIFGSLNENSNWKSPAKDETVYAIFPAKENSKTGSL